MSALDSKHISHISPYPPFMVIIIGRGMDGEESEMD